jgi:hypothetical protein
VYLYAFDLAGGAPSGLTTGEDLVDPIQKGVWYLVSPSGTPDPGTAAVTSESSSFGPILAYQSPNAFNAPGGPFPGPFTLYAFSADTSTSSACYDLCARIWSPLVTSTPPAAADSVDGSHLGTILRSDGTLQVTYYGHPLYLFAPAFTGTSGEGKGSLFGGTFHVVSLSGMPE